MNIFDIYTQEYDQWYENNRYAYLSEIEALKCITPSSGTGLEIGVGTGRFAEPLGVSVGIDPSLNMLHIAQKRISKIVAGMGENLPFLNDEFAFVLVVITLCFVKNVDDLIKEARRVLAYGGKIIFGIIDKNSHMGKVYQEKKKNKHRFYQEANFYSTDEVIQLLKNHNFVEISTYQTIFQPLSDLTKIDIPKKGFGSGGFSAISGEKC